MSESSYTKVANAINLTFDGWRIRLLVMVPTVARLPLLTVQHGIYKRLMRLDHEVA